ncbi:MAG: tetratricopeptide repeat protein [Xanthomonadales bacterium]|nr:tetratricopeptide repeat protein [Xanthomonadales bacterium]
MQSKLIATIAFLLLTALTAPRAEVLGAHPPMFLIQAEHALAAGDASRAIDLLEQRYKRLRAPEDRIRGYAVLCSAYLQEENVERASGACIRATKMDLATWSDFNNRGVLELHLGKLAEALASFEQAGSLNPQSEPVRNNIIRTRAMIDNELVSSSN